MGQSASLHIIENLLDMPPKKTRNHVEEGDSLGVKIVWANEVARISKPGPQKKDINYLEEGRSLGVMVGWVKTIVRASKPGPQKRI